MRFFEKKADLQAYLRGQRADNKSIGFVPTMGALHDGHIQLVKRARAENSLAVVSIFVNPTQFNNPEDLEKYPRMEEADKILLIQAGCDALFMPPVSEIYSQAELDQNGPGIDLGELDRVMEGRHRPGHFKGVVQVVSKLFDIVQPHKAYFGEKDFQQLTVIRELVRQTGSPVEIVACPTVREADGLAMSSRNMRLSPEERKAAPRISAVLFRVRQMAERESSVKKLKDFAEAELRAEPLFTLEYFEIADAITLQPITSLHGRGNAVACVAVRLGKVRLIDNVIL